MNGTTLGDEVWAQIKSIVGANPGPAQDAQGKALWEAICTKIVTHIQTNATVLPGIAVATTGSPTSHTGATTAPGIIE